MGTNRRESHFGGGAKLARLVGIFGVRSSPAAATYTVTRALEYVRSAGRTGVAAPGDGRTPLSCGPAVVGRFVVEGRGIC